MSMNRTDMKRNVDLKIIQGSYVDDLVDIINTDERLRFALGPKDKTTNRDEFARTIEKWQIRTNSKTFAIVLHDKAVGSISLSHIKEEDSTAQVGYWISSSYWNKGYTTEAFGQILDLARNLNIKLVSCSIKKDNIPSKKIWQKFNADFEKDEERFYPRLHL